MVPKQQFDAFLPSGAVGDAQSPFNSSSSISPRGLLPDYVPQPLYGGSRNSPSKVYDSAQSLSYFQQRENIQSTGSLTPSPSQNGPPISPPVSRSASSDGTNTTQVEYWRLHCRRIREQAEGERAHMVADRARADEVMDEERALWEEERGFLRAKVAELEAQLQAVTAQKNYQLNQGAILHQTIGGTIGGFSQTTPPQPEFQIPKFNGVGGSIDGTAAKTVPQESGRNPDGSALWAPAPRNPSRTFEYSEGRNLKVDSMSAPRETPLRVTSKELKPSDFGVSTPPFEEQREQSNEGSVVGEGSIDISHIQPELEGILLKASAVAPEFIAKVMSPSSSMSPSKNSSSAVSPPQPRDITNSQNGGPQRSVSRSKKTSTLEVIAAPENDRRTMHAGHTPNHSITTFDIGESGSITPTQAQHHRETLTTQDRQAQIDSNMDEDPALKGPLGLKNVPHKDEKFLAAVTDKLEAFAKNGADSPSGSSVISDESKVSVKSLPPGPSLSSDSKEAISSRDDNGTESEIAVDEVPRLRVKASTNFGRPFGSL